MKVTVQMHQGKFRLMVTNFGMTSPAGPRLIKGGICPVKEFSFFCDTVASRQAELLQEYLTNPKNFREQKPKKARRRRKA